MPKTVQNISYDGIAIALAQDYSSIYYVDIESNNYIEFSSNSRYRKLKVEEQGEDFFTDCARNIQRVIYHEDKERVTEALKKDVLLKEISEDKIFNLTYRLLFDDKPLYVTLKVILMEDNKHLLFGLRNIDHEMKRLKEYEIAKERNQTYSSITQALSKDYFSIYYVNSITNHYIEYSSNSEYKELEVETEGREFFEDCRKNIERVIHEEDKERLLRVIEKDFIMKELEKSNSFTTSYRLIMDGEPVYVNLKVIKLDDNEHLIFGVSSIDAQVKREEAYERALGAAREMANKDSLTGVKNKLAYTSKESELNSDIEDGEKVEFAIAVCDVNGLKKVNDTLGHKAGDRYIKEACSLVCNIFKHSPVYRIGGDEFVAVLQGHDYENRMLLMEELGSIVRVNKAEGSVVVAAGLSEFDSEKDSVVANVFERADARMYENKKALKGESEEIR